MLRKTVIDCSRTQRAANEAQRARAQLERALAAAAEARAAEARAEEARAAGGVDMGLTVRVPPSPTLSQAAGSAPAASPDGEQSPPHAAEPPRGPRERERGAGTRQPA